MHILSVNVFKVGNMYLRKSHLTKLKKKKQPKKTTIQCIIIHALSKIAEDNHIGIAKLIASPPEKNYHIQQVC